MLEKITDKLPGNKGIFGLDNFAMGIVTLVVTVAVGLMILSGMQDTEIVENGTNASDAIGTGIENLGSIMPWVGIIVIVVVAAIILNLLRSRGGLGGATGRK